MGNSLRQTVHIHLVSAHQAAKLLATLLRLARVTAGLVESNDGAVLSNTYNFDITTADTGL